MKHRLLVVDDELLQLEATQDYLERNGFIVDVAINATQALDCVRQGPLLYSLVILDYRLQDQSGATLASALTMLNPDLYILMFSGDSSREAIKESTRCGARGFIDKSEGKDVFLNEIKRWCLKYEQIHMPISARPVENGERILASIGMIGKSHSLIELAHLVRQLRDKDGSILILGESGTGKELIARALHPSTKHGLFRAVNCGSFATNPQLMSSTLFGHLKGAFTGATQDKKGIFEEVNGGTVFLDEIYALPLASQTELLRTLQEKTITPLGSTKEVPVRFRILSAAKPNLLEQVEKGLFKEDLYYRICETTLTIPPLRERVEDIPPLIDNLCQKWSLRNGETKTFLMRSIPFLQNYSWPGNVRELENFVNHTLNVSCTQRIAPEHLDPKFFIKPRDGQEPTVNLKTRMEESEKQCILSALVESRSIREAARKLGTSHPNLLRLMKKFGVDAKTCLKKEHCIPVTKVAGT